jgi:hypothetical protein
VVNLKRFLSAKKSFSTLAVSALASKILTQEGFIYFGVRILRRVFLSVEERHQKDTLKVGLPQPIKQILD